MTRSNWISPYVDYPIATFPVPEPTDEICSISNFIAARLTNTPDSAWQAVPVDLRVAFDLFAYRLASVLFRDGVAEPLELPPDIVSHLEEFEHPGYDAVELTFGTCLGCSPLSCNGQSFKAQVNRYRLVASEREGTELAREFSICKPEPGPYCMVEVWRDTRIGP